MAIYKNYRFFIQFLITKENRFFSRLFSVETKNEAVDIKDDDEFRVLELYPVKKKSERKKSDLYSDAQILPSREKRMPIDQDWPSVWPMAQTFRPSSVPLAVHQGYNQKGAPPGKYANAELMKIPNFLHLTPPAIKRHCAAIKKFCTAWPKGLETDEKCAKHFPLEVITSDYCHSSPTIRDERSRIVTVKVKLSSLNLDYHARDKLLRLIGEERYDKKNDIVIIVADRCPLRKQNYDYIMYLLTALYHESRIIEPWESEKTEADMEKFFYEGSRIEKHILDTLSFIRKVTNKEELPLDDLKDTEEVQSHKKAVLEIINDGESPYTVQKYKESVINALGIKTIVTESLGEVLPPE